MNGRGTATLLAAALLLAPSASAETYRILSGELTDAETGAAEALTGGFDASAFAGDTLPETLRALLLVHPFLLEAGGRSFGPRAPIAYQGLGPVVFLEPANQINVEQDGSLGLVFLRSGGEIVAESEDEVTFRFLDFRGSGSSAGLIGDAGLPRRLDIHGSLYEVDQRFRVLDGDCSPQIPGSGGSGGGGAVIEIVGGGDRIIEFESFDLDPDEVAEFTPPAGGTLSISRVAAPEALASELDGELVSDGAVFLVSPPAIEGLLGAGQEYQVPEVAERLRALTSGLAPTLEALGISAPSGATVTYDDSGALTVTTDGDLVIEDVSIDLPGLTSVTLVAGGSITVTGSLTVPPDVDLTLESGEVSTPPGDVIVLPPPIGIPFCFGLRPITEPVDPEQGPDLGREIASISLVATAAQPVAVDVWPGRHSHRVVPGFRQLIPVALLGAEDLDVRDVDLGSLRFGPGEASPRRLHRFRSVVRRDVNRDRIPDLVAWFSTRAAEIAYGDTSACLHGETTGGTLFEGCDAIDTRPTWMRRPLRDFVRRR